MATQPRQDRSRVRRDALLQAATDLLGEGGARAVTHRAVAARAGLPAAATTYYFESIRQLTDAALARHVSDRIAEIEELVATALTSGRSPEDVAARVAESLADRAADVVAAQFEIYLEAARNRALRRPVADALAAFEQCAARVLEALGARDPQRAAPAIVAVIDGFALHRLARPRPRDEELESLRHALRALFLVEVIPEVELGTWTKRLSKSPLKSKQ